MESENAQIRTENLLEKNDTKLPVEDQAEEKVQPELVSELPINNEEKDVNK